MHTSSLASPWIQRWSPLLPAGGHALDVACGSGRHSQWLAQHGHPVTAIDRDPAALQTMRALAAHSPAPITVVEADIENGPWPLPGQQFAAVVVTNYLWRALLPTLVASLAPGGVLLYETFALGNETVGRPARPDFLLRPGELLTVCADLQVVAYEHGFLDEPARFVQRIAAVRPDPAQPLPRHRLG